MKDSKTDKFLQSPSLVDKFSRTISYLRLSVTDRCNLRCHYCMPCESTNEDKSENIIKNLKPDELLSYEELLRIVRVAVNLGMSKIRLTGGEPLVRRGIVDFIQSLSQLEGLDQIRLTSNGVLLAENVDQLYSLGVRHLNISLDTLDPEKFEKITGRPLLDRVLDGIDKAQSKGFRIKLNVVAMDGVNDNEFADFAELALEKKIQVRFIEFMPIGKGSNWQKKNYIRADEIRQRLLNEYTLEQVKGFAGDGPARMYSLQDGNGREGRVGFISPISHHFCENCNRLRLTSEGKLRACLLHDGDTDLKAILRGGGKDSDIEEAIRQTILFKPKGHDLDDEDRQGGNGPACRVNMSRIGG